MQNGCAAAVAVCLCAQADGGQETCMAMAVVRSRVGGAVTARRLDDAQGCVSYLCAVVSQSRRFQSAVEHAFLLNKQQQLRDLMGGWTERRRKDGHVHHKPPAAT